MSEWFLEAFSAPGDKAKLLAILFSSLVALFIFIANQWYIDRRTKKELYINKIEELYIASIEYFNAAEILVEYRHDYALKLDGAVNTSKVERRKIYDDWDRPLRKIEMIFGLYFPNEGFDYDHYTSDLLITYETETEAADEIAIEKYELSRDHMMEREESLTRLCRDLMAQYTESFFSILLNKIKVWFERLKSVTQIKSKRNPL